MNVEVYLCFYNATKSLGWWRSILTWFIQLGTCKVSHVGLVFKFPCSTSWCPFVIDGKPTILVREDRLNKLGTILVEKHYIGNVKITIDELLNLIKTSDIVYWYKIIYWLWIERFINPNKKPAFSCTRFCTDYLENTFGYSFKKTVVPFSFYKEIKNDYSSYWR